MNVVKHKHYITVPLNSPLPSWTSSGTSSSWISVTFLCPSSRETSMSSPQIHPPSLVCLSDSWLLSSDNKNSYIMHGVNPSFWLVSKSFQLEYMYRRTCTNDMTSHKESKTKVQNKHIPTTSLCALLLCTEDTKMWKEHLLTLLD